MSRTKVFTCYECGDEYRISELSQVSLDASRQPTKLKAIQVLPLYQHICTSCAGEWDDDDDLDDEYADDLAETYIWDEYN